MYLFIALILRNRLYTCLKEEVKKNDRKFNFMTVAAALRELEKIEMIRGSDNEYHLDHAVTATQKTILSAFGMASQDIKKKAQAEVFHLKDKYDAAGVEWTSEKETRSSETGDPESDRSKSAIA